MVEPKSSSNRMKSMIGRMGERVRTTDFSDIGKRIGKPILEPPFLEKFRPASQAAKVFAFAMLPIVIIVSFAVLIAVSNTLEAVLIGVSFGNQTDIIAWLITAINLTVFITTCWMWFQWVITGGFGLLDV